MARNFFQFLISVCLIFLVGCGGSGGSFLGKLDYITDWTNFAAAGGGQSQRVQLFDSSGSLVKSLVLNQDTVGQVTSSFTGLSAGNYHFQIQLFSARDAGGTEVGDLDAIVDPSQQSSFSSAVGNVPTRIAVSPATITLSVQQSESFYATAYISNTATFVAPGSLTWSTLGSVATVNSSSGLLVATNPGTGSVRVTYGPSGLIGGAAITVNAVSTTTGKWTVMVYMNAANDLSEFSKLNVNQMETVAGNPDVRTIVQWKQVASLPYPVAFNGTRRYLAKQDTSTAINSQLLQDMGTGVDMGDPQTLNDFINWTKTYYPAQHYVLIVWNHGNGWKRSSDRSATRAVSYDDEFGTSIQTWQLAQALGNNHFDILAWDASLMQMAEVADEVKDKADFIAGSEESPPGAGYPYDLILSKFRDNPNDTPRNLSKAFVDGMIQGYASSSSSKITQSVIDTTQLPNLVNAVAGLSTALKASPPSYQSLIPNVRAATQAYSQTGSRYYRDLFDLTVKLDGTSTPGDVTSADAAVRAAITQAVVWEGHNSLSPNSHGIAIDFSPSSTFVTYATDYSLLRFAGVSGWGSWLAVAP